MSRDWREQLQLEQEHEEEIEKAPNFVVKGLLNHLYEERQEKLIEEQSIADGIANLHEEEALRRHEEETNAINDKRNKDKAVA
jgi:hypothetical protein